MGENTAWETIVLTGASAGIGAAAALALAGPRVQLVLVGRNPAKLASVVDRVARLGPVPDSIVCDFARLDDVRAAAEQIRRSYAVVDVLANNAGLIAARQEMTVDGHDMTIQVNHLAPYLLTRLLLDRIVAAASGRIISTSSSAHVFGRLDTGDLDFHRRRRTRWRSYADSKQANVAFSTELSWRLRDTSVVPTSFHPGAVRSDFGDSTGLFRLAKKIAPVGFVTPSQGASTLVALATSPVGQDIAGGYYDSGMLAAPSARATRPELAARLWQVSADAVGLQVDAEP